MTDKLIIGEILKPQGIRGEIKVKCYLDTLAEFKSFKKIYIEGTEYKVLSFKQADGFVFLGLSGIADRNTAELMRGKKIEGNREDAKPLEEGRYYIVDVIGCVVQGLKGKVYGEVIDIFSAKTDVYTIKNGEETLMFPIADGVVESFDIDNKKIIVNEKRFSEVVVK